MITSLGIAVTQFMDFLGGLTLLFKKTWDELKTKPFYFYLVIEQVYFIGVRSFILVSATAFSTGLVMALQFGLGLERFGGKFYVPKVVALALVRELGPVFTSLMVAGRVGAGITAEVGSMAVTQQLDAIRALGTSPIKKIVIPRVLACVIAVPLLSVLADIIGVLSSCLIGVTELGLDPVFYIQKVITTVKLADFLSGIGKSVFFGLFIGLVGCYYGMRTSGGTQGVGIATTKSVVVSSLFVVVGDFFLTKMFWVLERW
ncbi:MAG: ABC transporter permease [Oligoflexia bacterium]|nr:ABC transporter permease [Oligoflexia bacterium]